MTGGKTGWLGFYSDFVPPKAVGSTVAISPNAQSGVAVVGADAGLILPVTGSRALTKETKNQDVARFERLKVSVLAAINLRFLLASEALFILKTAVRR